MLQLTSNLCTFEEEHKLQKKKAIVIQRQEILHEQREKSVVLRGWMEGHRDPNTTVYLLMVFGDEDVSDGVGGQCYRRTSGKNVAIALLNI